MKDTIYRADAIEAVTDIQDGSGQRYYLAVSLVDKMRSLPSAEAVSREEVTEIKNNYINEISGLLNKIDALSAEAVQGDGRNNIKRYPNCQMRTSLGNCDAIGGFCTSINAPICDAFHKLTEAVQGEWESLKVVDISRSGVQELQEQQCSHCGKWLTTPYMYYPKKHNFCPNCGARMNREDGEA